MGGGGRQQGDIVGNLLFNAQSVATILLGWTTSLNSDHKQKHGFTFHIASRENEVEWTEKAESRKT